MSARGRQRGGRVHGAPFRQPFNPAHVAGLFAWYRASQGATLGSTPLATGTAPPVVTIATTDGALPVASGLRIEITTTGARGTADFRWSVNDGATFEASAVLTAATVTLGPANITVTFPVGTYTNDNVYRATCSQWNDMSPNALNLSQATAANQPVRNPKNTSANGRPTIDTSDTTDVLTNATAGALNPLHDGTGGTLVYAIRVPSPVPAQWEFFGTNNAEVSNPGVRIAVLSPSLFHIVTNAAGTRLFLPATAVSANTNYVFSVGLKTGASPEFYARKDGTQFASGSFAAAASAANHGGSVAVGGRQNGSLSVASAMFEFIVYNSQLSAADVQSVERWLGREYGVTVA